MNEVIAGTCRYTQNEAGANRTRGDYRVSVGDIILVSGWDDTSRSLVVCQLMWHVGRALAPSKNLLAAESGKLCSDGEKERRF